MALKSVRSLSNVLIPVDGAGGVDTNDWCIMVLAIKSKNPEIKATTDVIRWYKLCPQRKIAQK